MVCIEAIKGLHPHPMNKLMIPGCTYYTRTRPQGQGHKEEADSPNHPHQQQGGRQGKGKQKDKERSRKERKKEGKKEGKKEEGKKRKKERKKEEKRKKKKNFFLAELGIFVFTKGWITVLGVPGGQPPLARITPPGNF